MTCVTTADDKHQIIIATQAFGVGQEQITLQPMVEMIKENFTDDVFADGCVLTADTGYCSEDNLKYLHDNKIESVIPDNQFRLRDPIYSDSETFKAHKEQRQKTRKDNKKTRKIFSHDEFTVDFQK